MARGFPKPAVDHLRRVYLDIAVGALAAAHVIFQRRVDASSRWGARRPAGGFFLQVEQLHLAAQLAVVALGGLFQHGQMRLQIVAVLEGDTIDPLQLARLLSPRQ